MSPRGHASPHVVPAECAIAHGRTDPYRVIYRLGKVADTVCRNDGRWLWVPAFAETTKIYLALLLLGLLLLLLWVEQPFELVDAL